MQYPQIQFYRGSLVRLASGKLKQVEELSSDDFLESAPLASEVLASPTPVTQVSPTAVLSLAPAAVKQQQQQQVDDASQSGRTASQSPIAMDLDCDTAPEQERSGAILTNNRCDQQPIRSISDTDHNNNLSDDDQSDVELVDVVTSDDLVADLSKPFRTHSEQLQQHLLRQQASSQSSMAVAAGNSSSCDNNGTATNDMMQSDAPAPDPGQDTSDHLYIESSVVRDFLEVGPPCSTSPASSTASLSSASAPAPQTINQFAFTINSTTGSASATLTSNLFCSSSSTSSSLSSAGSSTASSSTGSLATAVSPQPVAAHQHSQHLSHTHQQHSSAATTPTPAHHLRMHSPSYLSTGTSSSTASQQHQHQHNYTAQQIIQQQNPTVLIKFFLETSRTIAFIEVPIEHPFFVFHRGWSSWNPQRTYDKFGLKCRKLKIGDTCISLVRRQNTNRPSHSSLSQPIIQFDRRSLPTTLPITSAANETTTSHQHSNDNQSPFKHRQALHKNSNKQQQESDQCNILFSSIKIHE